MRSQWRAALSGSRRWPPTARRSSASRVAAGAFLAGVLLAVLLFYTESPPHVGGEDAGVGLAARTSHSAPGVPYVLQTVVSVYPSKPGIGGCDPWATVIVSMSPRLVSSSSNTSKEGGYPQFDGYVLTLIGAELQRASAADVPRKFPTQGTLDEGGKDPPVQRPIPRRHGDYTTVAGTAAGGAVLHVAFRASLVSRRGFGACWVQLPALLGEQIIRALDAGYGVVREQDLDVGAGFAMRTGFGQTRIENSQASLNRAETAPESTAGLNTWTCTAARLPDQYENIDEGTLVRGPACDALVATDTPWRGTFRDVGLLLLGVFLSLAVEFGLRARDERRLSAGSEGPREIAGPPNVEGKPRRRSPSGQSSELASEAQANITAPSAGTRRAPRRDSTSLGDLIEAGLIAAHGTLTSHLRGGGHEARYSRDNVEYKGVSYGSPSSAGKAALGRNVNGWDFWHVERDGRPIKLAIIRAEYLAAKRGVAGKHGAR
jgi:hypothetical protein